MCTCSLDVGFKDTVFDLQVTLDFFFFFFLIFYNIHCSCHAITVKYLEIANSMQYFYKVS